MISPVLTNEFPVRAESRVVAERDDFLLVIEGREPVTDPAALFDWFARNRAIVERNLVKYGAILFRGFDVGLEEFKALVKAISPDERLLDFTGMASPRKEIGDGVYVSTTYPNKLELMQHQEFAYRRWWPLKMFFYCEIPSPVGGETPLCNIRALQRRLSPGIYKRFKEKGVLYVRNYTEGVVPPWQQSYGTSDRRFVEDFCRRNMVDVEWLPGERLRTRHIAQGVAAHPMTGEELWFNSTLVMNLSHEQGHMSPSLAAYSAIMKPEILDQLMNSTPLDVAVNTFWGDGNPIPHSVLDEIKRATDEEKVVFPWQKGDFVLVDNMVASHGRNPYEGERKILVSQKEPYAEDVEMKVRLNSLAKAA